MSTSAVVNVHETFEVDAPQQRVWDALEDVQLIADCVPNATLAPAETPGLYSGTIAVKLGPLRTEFKGTVTIERSAGNMEGRVSSRGIDKLGSKVNASMRYVVGPREGGSPGALVSLDGTIDVSGSLAKFAATGGQVLARAVTREFAARLESRLKALAPNGDRSA